jgi:hypothetical protein
LGTRRDSLNGSNNQNMKRVLNDSDEETPKHHDDDLMNKKRMDIFKQRQQRKQLKMLNN